MLRLSLEAGAAERAQLPLRQGRAIKWIEEALSPLQPAMSEPEVHRLAIAIRSAIGIEALAWLTDIAGLTRDDATTLMRWSAQALLEPLGAESRDRMTHPGTASNLVRHTAAYGSPVPTKLGQSKPSWTGAGRYRRPRDAVRGRLQRTATASVRQWRRPSRSPRRRVVASPDAAVIKVAAVVSLFATSSHHRTRSMTGVALVAYYSAAVTFHVLSNDSPTDTMPAAAFGALAAAIVVTDTRPTRRGPPSSCLPLRVGGSLQSREQRLGVADEHRDVVFLAGRECRLRGFGGLLCRPVSTRGNVAANAGRAARIAG